MSFVVKFLEFIFWRSDQMSEQYGVGIHDIDGNGFLDIYANHHGYASREIIYDFATDAPRHVERIIGGDLHGVTFFDIDQDGDADLLQATGSDRGTVNDPDYEGAWTRVNLNDGGVIETRNSADLFGIEYGPGRKRMLYPINFDGELAIFIGVQNDREDGLYPGELFGRNAAGSYDPISPLAAITGEFAKGVHLGPDRFVDVINVDVVARELRVFENSGSGFGPGVVLNRGQVIYDVVTGDFDGDLRPEILLSRGDAPGRERLFKKDAATGAWGTINNALMPTRETSAISIVAADFDNDGDLDYAALQLKAGLDVYLYLNRGDGTFELGSRVQDPSVSGRAEFLFAGDFNRDGALDLVATTSYRYGRDEGMYVLLKGEPTGNNWLSIQLRGVVSETGGLGARVYVTTPDGEVQVREQDGGLRFQAQDSTDLHFGLGAATVADVLIVWADGIRQTIAGVTANQHVVLTERREAGFDMVVEGTIGADTLKGSSRRDFVDAGAGADVVAGLQGDDALYGGGGADNLFGGAGDDLLVGGPGRDRLTGDAGADVFLFAALADSRPGANRDQIRDFAPTVDVIDVSGIDAHSGQTGNQAFVYIGAAAFGDQARQLRFGAGLLEGDVNGDGVADFQVAVSRVAALAETDFVL